MRQAPSIDAYGGGGFRVSGQWREGSLMILGDEPRSWSGRALADLTPDDFASVLAHPEVVEFVLLGTGPAQGLPPRPVREVLARAGVGLEFMSTENAARTYNVLASEGRRMAAALIAI